MLEVFATKAVRFIIDSVFPFTSIVNYETREHELLSTDLKLAAAGNYKDIKTKLTQVKIE